MTRLILRFFISYGNVCNNKILHFWSTKAIRNYLFQRKVGFKTKTKQPIHLINRYVPPIHKRFHSKQKCKNVLFQIRKTKTFFRQKQVSMKVRLFQIYSESKGTERRNQNHFISFAITLPTHMHTIVFTAKCRSDGYKLLQLRCLSSAPPL